MAPRFADILFRTTSGGFTLSPAKEPSSPAFSLACKRPRLEKHKKQALQKIEHQKSLFKKKKRLIYQFMCKPAYGLHAKSELQTQGLVPL